MINTVELANEHLKQLVYMSCFLSEEQKTDLETAERHQYDLDGKTYFLYDGESVKIAVGPDYNFVFNKDTGFFARWGETVDADPEFSPIGGEILDIEITTICHGINGKLCPFCYKANTPNGKNMSFDTFKTIMSKMGNQLTQVAFGADSKGTSNPDLFKMADYCREIGVVPNLTVADISNEIADKLADVMGAVAVSRYHDKNVCYDSIKKLTDRGMTQVNMHFMISEETYDDCLETLEDIKADPRLKKMNAIVLLSLKQKGRGTGYTCLSQDKYDYLVQFCLDNNISFGMDSCGAKKFLDSVKDHENYEKYKVIAEPCESTAFSQYIDVNGEFFPCSFCEEIEGWEKGIPVDECDNFLDDIWYNDRVVKFRDVLTANCDNCHKARECPIYNV